MLCIFLENGAAMNGFVESIVWENVQPPSTRQMLCESVGCTYVGVAENRIEPTGRDVESSTPSSSPRVDTKSSSVLRLDQCASPKRTTSKCQRLTLFRLPCEGEDGRCFAPGSDEHVPYFAEGQTVYVSVDNSKKKTSKRGVVMEVVHSDSAFVYEINHASSENGGECRCASTAMELDLSVEKAKLQYYRTCGHMLTPITSRGREYVVDLAMSYRDPFVERAGVSDAPSSTKNDWDFVDDTLTCDYVHDSWPKDAREGERGCASGFHTEYPGVHVRPSVLSTTRKTMFGRIRSSSLRS